MSKIHLNLGSNIGDRRALMGRAVALLAARLAPARLLLSDYVESEPWGYDSANTYLNMGVMVLTERTLCPEAVLAATQSVELAVGLGAPHRNPDGTYCDRPIDIDIIDMDGLHMDTPALTLPHPRAALRPFVTGPMRQLEERLEAETTKIS